MTEKTEHREYHLPEAGEGDWHQPVNENWQLIDNDVQAALDAAQNALEAATGGGGANGTDDGSGTDDGGEGTPGYRWDQTHVDTSWLVEADEGDDLEVIKVTTLDGSGSGSLDEAVNATDDPTLIVFEVGGVIDTGGTTYIRVRSDNTFIAGQTAPYPGISIIRGGPRIHSDNVIISHVSCLPGNDVDDPNKARALTFDSDTSDLLADHCTAGWSPDTNVNFREDATRQAFMNGINAEALNVSDHHEGHGDGSWHGYGTLQRDNNSRSSMLGVINMHNWKRNPFSQYSASSMNWISVYSFNWGARHYHGSSSGSPEIDFIGNVSYDGPDTRDGYPIFKDGTEPVVYYENNLILNGDHSLGDAVTFVDEPMNLPEGLNEEDIVPPGELEDFLVDVAGPRPADRPPVERRMIEDFVNKDGAIINSFDDHPEYPDYDATERSLELPGSSLLDWLQHFTDEVELGTPNPLH